jgi:nitroreductase
MAKQHGSAFAKNAPLAIVVCADSHTSDVWIEDASIAAIILHLTAQSLGLGSCWIQIRNRMKDENRSSQDYLSKLLRLPDNLKVLAIMAIGYPDEEKSPHGKEELQFDRIYSNTYGAPL